MKLYEINREIEELVASLEPDPETGEIDDCDKIFAQIEALQMEKSDILQYLAKVVIDLRASAAALKSEEKRLRERRTLLEKKDERLMAVLDRECGGQKTDCGVATMCYRRTEKVSVDDPETALEWLKSTGHDECFRVPEPEVSKSDIKALLKNGTEVPGVSLVQDVSCSLR